MANKIRKKLTQEEVNDINSELSDLMLKKQKAEAERKILLSESGKKISKLNASIKEKLAILASGEMEIIADSKVIRTGDKVVHVDRETNEILSEEKLNNSNRQIGIEDDLSQDKFY